MKNETKITYLWDDEGDTDGWYAIIKTGDVQSDSLKLWEPAYQICSAYDRDEEQKMIDALRKAYPGCEIVAHE